MEEGIIAGQRVGMSWWEEKGWPWGMGSPARNMNEVVIVYYVHSYNIEANEGILRVKTDKLEDFTIINIDKIGN